jgi:hypothetical protein
MSNLYESFKEAFLYRLNEGYKEVKARFIKDGAEEESVSKLLDLHKKLKDMRRLPNQDLNIDTLAKGKSFEELKDYLSKYSEGDLKKKTDIDAELRSKKVAENSKYTVYKMDTAKEAYRFHGKVHWCISSGSKEDAKTMWNHYSRNSNFYVAIGKNVEYPNNYLAIQVFENQFTVWDASDESFNFTSPEEMYSHFGLPDFGKIEYFKFDLEKYGFKLNSNGKWDLNKDLAIDLTLEKHFIKNGKFAIKFGTINGDFNCADCKLISLEGAPEVVKGIFDCAFNKLTSLEGAPKEVGSHFDCSHNPLVTLKGMPEKVGSDFYCKFTKLTSLENGPKEIGGDYFCEDNELTSLEGAPKKVKTFNCAGNKLKDLEGAPKKVDGIFNCVDNQLITLKGCPKEISGTFICYNNQLTSLKYGPKKVGGVYSCAQNNLTSLKGAPEKINGRFNCSYNNLTSLKDGPKEAKMYYCTDNPGKFTEEDVKKVCKVSGSILT